MIYVILGIGCVVSFGIGFMFGHTTGYRDHQRWSDGVGSRTKL